ncbi:MAG TPA: WecB/TagA/CpsF family glycosyltransferase [Anaerolineales bacterium]|nr:WecB/TagA/CpsF family glycosyltransferase [Anaerolineales bacterium]
MPATSDSILGVPISAVNMPQALQQLDVWVQRREHKFVCVTPAHSIMECHAKPHLRAVFNASAMSTPDGMAVVWLMRLKGHGNVRQVCGTELLKQVCQLGTGYRHFFYGGAPGVIEKLVTELRRLAPGLAVAGTYSPPFRTLTPDEDRGIVEMINASRADILWVGLSSPKQEIWMHAHLGAIQAPVMVGVGAAFDFVSGARKRAPRWIQQVGMEWLYRLASEPRRLWPRYRQYPLFVLLVTAEMLGLKQFGAFQSSIAIRQADRRRS